MATKSSSVPPLHVLLTGPPGIGKTTLVRKVCDILQDRHGVAVQGFYTQEVRGGGVGGRGSRTGFDVVTFDGKRGPLARVQSNESGFPPARKTHCVGKYLVHLESFEAIALPSLNISLDSVKGKTISEVNSRDLTDLSESSDAKTEKSTVPKEGDTAMGRNLVVIVDEVGKMELFSHKFVEQVKLLFETGSGPMHHMKTPPSPLGLNRVVLLATIPVARAHQKSHWLVEGLRQRRDCQLYEVSEKNRERLVNDIVTFILQRLQ